ncbi:hypothetical protein Pa4123_51530 [Phytohabitans aurantiacus]|uniref:Uncharacterized protein n=1 Tax=Phytohabitans aurantiacus TaxID=3016789 RepID=A0ABQ5R0R1_9ACTN|nr:hypothetical protein Pa4123_51530 [Phytohabitans aurantiacus]
MLVPAPRWLLLANRAAGLVLIFGCCAAGVVVTLSWPGPVDTAWTLLIAVCLAAPISVIGPPWRYLVTPRTPVTLTDAGIDTGTAIVPWADVSVVETVWAPATGRRITVRRRDGRTVPLWILTGAVWPDRQFEANLARLAGCAHVQNPSITVRRHNLPRLVTAAMLVLLIPAAAWRVQEHGLVGPWSAVAPYTTACDLLTESPGAALWPADFTVRSGMVDESRSFCTWETLPDQAAQTPLDYMTLSVTVHGWAGMHSPVATAAHDHTIRATVGAKPLQLGRITDDAVITTGRMSVEVAARRANITLTVRVTCITVAGCPLYAEHIAGQVAYWALIGIRPAHPDGLNRDTCPGVLFGFAARIAASILCRSR